MNLNEILDIIQIVVSIAIIVANCQIIHDLNEISKLEEKRKKAKRDREILDSVTEVDSCKNSRPVYHGSKNHDMFETMFNAPGGKPIRSINKDF